MSHHKAGVVIDLKRGVLAILDDRFVNRITSDTARCHFCLNKHHIARRMKRRRLHLEVRPELTDRSEDLIDHLLRTYVVSTVGKTLRHFPFAIRGLGLSPCRHITDCKGVVACFGGGDNRSIVILVRVSSTGTQETEHSREENRSNQHPRTPIVERFSPTLISQRRAFK